MEKNTGNIEGILSVRESGNHTRKWNTLLVLWQRCYEVIFAHAAEIDPCVHYRRKRIIIFSLVKSFNDAHVRRSNVGLVTVAWSQYFVRYSEHDFYIILQAFAWLCHSLLDFHMRLAEAQDHITISLEPGTFRRSSSTKSWYFNILTLVSGWLSYFCGRWDVLICVFEIDTYWPCSLLTDGNHCCAASLWAPGFTRLRRSQFGIQWRLLEVSLNCVI